MVAKPKLGVLRAPLIGIAFNPVVKEFTFADNSASNNSSTHQRLPLDGEERGERRSKSRRPAIILPYPSSPSTAADDSSLRSGEGYGRPPQMVMERRISKPEDDSDSDFDIPCPHAKPNDTTSWRSECLGDTFRETLIRTAVMSGLWLGMAGGYCMTCNGCCGACALEDIYNF